jgi:hypothetical protein
MPGQQHRIAVSGSKNEDVAQQIIGRIASYSKIPREHDYGIDFYYQVRVPSGPSTYTVNELFALQVKGQGDLLFGRVEKGTWKSHEIQWLRALAVPLYLVQVDPSLTAIELFSLGPIWRVLWQTQPFQLKCITRAATNVPYDLQEASKEPIPESNQHAPVHDQHRWTIDLGPPFLRLSNVDMNDPTFHANAIDLLKKWLHLDRKTLLRFQLRVAIIDNIARWHTNDFSPQIVFNRAMFWNSAPGMNVGDLAPVAAEVLVNLGVNLQSQNDSSAYSLIEPLQYLERVGVLDELGKGLLRGLLETRTSGRGPREHEK